MAYDEVLASRVRSLCNGLEGLVEKKMFGGVAILVQGKMSVGVHRDDLIVRIDPAETAEALREPGVRPFDITGRPMKGWLMIAQSALADDSLARWVERGIAYASSLPPK
jgi:TfoX/Sxy family transcriptional regulator of competence genes